MIENDLVLARSNIFQKFIDIFAGQAAESHVLGSVAREDADPFSDLDIWFTFNDDKYNQVLESRVKYFNQIREVIHMCEPPQNAPIGGIHTAMIIKSSDCLTMVDVYMCPLSNSFITVESRKIFGVTIPILEMGQNPQKIEVNSDYRIDFFICFVFNSIKKIIRKEEFPLEPLLREYKNLEDKYGFKLNEIFGDKQDFEMLKEIIHNTKMVSNNKQQKVLDEILNFGEKVFSTC